MLPSSDMVLKKILVNGDSSKTFCLLVMMVRKMVARRRKMVMMVVMRLKMTMMTMTLTPMVKRRKAIKIDCMIVMMISQTRMLVSCA